jgi:formylglycine-generating enzyme required for sulfatase activity
MTLPRLPIVAIATWSLLSSSALAACDGIDLSVGSETRCLKPGAGKTIWFRDAPTAPEMVVVPAGQFTMGSPESDPDRVMPREKQIPVAIAAPFAVGRFVLSRGEFAAFVKATARKLEPCLDKNLGPSNNWLSPGFQQNDRHPVVCVNWNDAKAYVEWLSSTTGKTYRLLSDSEREYVTRAGTTTLYWTGDKITPQQANFAAKATVPVDRFAANPWGLYNVHGNVLEWLEDCWRDTNAGNPGDGRPRLTGPRIDCRERMLRGGAWNDPEPRFLRSANRDRLRLEGATSIMGFRVARTL